MTSAFRPRTAVLFLGDLFFFVFSLWLSLFLRTFEIPSRELFTAHFVPFSLLFGIWVIVFFIAGLYESRFIVLARRALSTSLLVSQTINIAIAALFFFSVPLFGIAPKTLLVIYLFVSFLLVLFWRAIVFPLLGLQKGEKTIVIGKRPEIKELIAALSIARHAPAHIVEVIEPGKELVERVNHAIAKNKPRIIIADFNDGQVSTALPHLYNLLRQGIRFFDVTALYEDVFGRIPLSLVDERWLALNVSHSARTIYDPMKRILDIVCGGIFGVLSLIFYPGIALAIKLDDGGPIFIAQERVGENGEIIQIHKFRTMSGNDHGRYGPDGKSKLVVTRVGKFLRSSRLDELPQLWDVVRGSLSLIGPRPEFPSLVTTYEKEIPFYAVRHLIKPGLSGSAQLYYHGDPHHAADIESTKMKLSHDLFYIKHRSLTLDLSIGIKTIRRILMRSNA